MQKTLNQIRSSVAIRYKGNLGKGAEGGDKVKSFPTMIQINGLLAALAYACEKKQNGDLKNSAEHKMSEAIIAHFNELKKNGYKICSEPISNPDEFSRHLSDKCSPTQFRRINAEVMAFLNYLRRFAS